MRNMIKDDIRASHQVGHTYSGICRHASNENKNMSV